MVGETGIADGFLDRSIVVAFLVYSVVWAISCMQLER